MFFGFKGFSKVCFLYKVFWYFLIGLKFLGFSSCFLWFCVGLNFYRSVFLFPVVFDDPFQVLCYHCFGCCPHLFDFERLVVLGIFWGFGLQLLVISSCLWPYLRRRSEGDNFLGLGFLLGNLINQGIARGNKQGMLLEACKHLF